MRGAGLVGVGVVLGSLASKTWSDPGCQLGLVVFLIAEVAAHCPPVNCSRSNCSRSSRRRSRPVEKAKFPAFWARHVGCSPSR